MRSDGGLGGLFADGSLMAFLQDTLREVRASARGFQEAGPALRWKRLVL